MIFQISYLNDITHDTHHTQLIEKRRNSFLNKLMPNRKMLS